MGRTHFLSIPLGTIPEFREKATDIIEKVLKRDRSFINEDKLQSLTTSSPLIQSGFLEDGALIDPVNMHITVVAMTLKNGTEYDTAVHLLKERVPEIVSRHVAAYLESVECSAPEKTRWNQVKIAGLHTMEDQPKNARVLYAGVKVACEEFQHMLEDIKQVFVDSGLDCDTKPMKLHCTLAKTSSAKCSELQKKFGINAEFLTRTSRLHPDRTMFGIFAMNELQLCRMGDFSRDGTGYTVYSSTSLQM